MKCYLPKSIGRCRASQQVYYYNPDIASCEEFSYGGCDGNTNRFETMDECTEECVLPLTPGKNSRETFNFFINSDTIVWRHLLRNSFLLFTSQKWDKELNLKRCFCGKGQEVIYPWSTNCYQYRRHISSRFYQNYEAKSLRKCFLITTCIVVSSAGR